MTDSMQRGKRPASAVLGQTEIDTKWAAKRQSLASDAFKTSKGFILPVPEPLNEQNIKLDENTLLRSSRTERDSIEDSIDDREASAWAASPSVKAATLHNETSESQRSCDESSSGWNGSDGMKNASENAPLEILSDHSIIECDTCFGMIQLPTFNLRLSTLVEREESRIEVLLRFNGRSIVVRNPESMQYGGLLELKYSEALADLSERFGLVCDAYLVLHNDSKHRLKSYVLCIVLQGRREDADQIGSLLSDADIYLQTPRAFYKPLKHFNPHYLYRPSTVDGAQDSQEEDESDLDTIGRASLSDSNPLELSIHEAIDSALGPRKYAEIMASPRLRTSLKPHQLKALSMMVEKESGRVEGNDFDSMWTTEYDSSGRKRYRNTVTGFTQRDTPVPCLGGILADEMGLGKTLSTLALITLRLDETENTPWAPSRSHTTIVITPMSLLQTWEEQIQSHVYFGRISYYKYHGSSKHISPVDLHEYDIVLTTYDTLVFEAQSKRHDNNRSESLLDLEWFRVILDEAHLIRNNKSKRHRVVTELKSRHRWCLTGTPIFNRVEDFGALLSFLRASPFDSRKYFSFFVSEPLKNSPLRALSNLRKLFQSMSLRRRKHSVQEDLEIPARECRIQEVILEDSERQRYDKLKNSWDKILQTQTESASRRISAQCIFQIILRLRQFCNHGLDLFPSSALAMFSEPVNEDSTLKEALEASETCAICIRTSWLQSNGSSQPFALGCGHLVCPQCTTKMEDDLFLDEVDCNLCLRTNDTDNASYKYVAAYEESTRRSDPKITESFYRPSSKVVALMRNLEREMLFGSPHVKSIIFSGWKKMLDLVEKALSNNNIPFERIDGSLSDRARRDVLHKFRTRTGYCVLLASIGSSGVGLDLTVASRVHMLEPQWSPMAEEQALDRVHRMGQKREVIVTRYIVKNSIEEYVVGVQCIKSNVINQSVEGNDSQEPLTAKERFMKYLQEC